MSKQEEQFPALQCRRAEKKALEAKLEAMERLLEECRKAIDNVPDRAVFGIGGEGLTHWYLADELLFRLAAAQEEQEDE